jgi:hypothetical protein
MAKITQTAPSPDNVVTPKIRGKFGRTVPVSVRQLRCSPWRWPRVNSFLEPRAYCMLRFMALEIEEMSLIRREASAE